MHKALLIIEFPLRAASNVYLVRTFNVGYSYKTLFYIHSAITYRDLLSNSQISIQSGFQSDYNKVDLFLRKSQKQLIHDFQ